MTDYIKRDALLEARELAICAYENAGIFNADAIRNHLKPLLDAVVDTPAADVAEVVHGRWILHHTVTGNPYTECSNCCTNVAVKTDKGTSAKLDMRGMPYCPFCSAKMDGGFDDATS